MEMVIPNHMEVVLPISQVVYQRRYVPLLLCQTNAIHQPGTGIDRKFHDTVRSWRLARSWVHKEGSRQVYKIRWCSCLSSGYGPSFVFGNAGVIASSTMVARDSNSLP